MSFLNNSQNQQGSFLGNNLQQIQNIDTQGKINQFVVVDENGNLNYVDQQNFINPPTIQPSQTDNQILVTQNGLVSWNYLQNSMIPSNTISANKTTFCDQNIKTTDSVNFQQVSVSNLLPIQDQNLTSKKYVDDQNNLQNTYINQQISQTVTTCNNYSDSQNLSLQNSMTTYINQQDQNNLNTAKSYADSQDQIILQQAKNYTDQHQFTIQDNSIENVKLKDLTIENNKIAENTINQSKIISLPFTKISSTIDLNQIQDTYINTNKLNISRNARQFWVCFQTGVDSINNGTQIKPFRTVQYAIDQCTQNAYIINILSPSTDEDILISGKLQLCLKFLSSGVYNSPQQTCKSITIQNSSSIKIVSVQVDSRTFQKHAIQIINSQGVYIKDCTILADSSNFGLYVNNQSTYTQLESVETSLFLQQSQPAQNCTILCSKNTNIMNAFSNTVNNYSLVCENCNFQNSVNFSAGSLIASKSQFYALLAFSSSSPNILLLMNTLHMSTILAAQIIQKSGTSFWCISNDSIYDQANSSFSGTEVLQRLLPYTKIAPSTANRYLSTDNSGNWILKDIQTQTIGNNQITSLDASKLFQTLPYTQKLVKTNNLGGFNFNAQLSNSDIDLKTITIDKLYGNSTQGYILTQGPNNEIIFSAPSQQIVYPNTQTFLSGFSYFSKIDSFDWYSASNTPNQANLNGDDCVLFNQKYIDQSTAQVRFSSFRTMLSEIPNNEINVSKILRPSNKSYCFLGQITNGQPANDLQLALCNSGIFSRSLTISANNANTTIPNFTGSSTHFLNCNSSGQIDWVQIPSQTTLTKGQFLIGNQSNQSEAMKLSDNAMYLDSAYFNSNINVPLNCVLTTNLLANNCKWDKINSLNLSSTNTPSSNQILSYNSANNGSFTWINNTPTISDNSISLSKLIFNNNAKTEQNLVGILNGNLQVVDYNNPCTLNNTIILLGALQQYYAELASSSLIFKQWYSTYNQYNMMFNNASWYEWTSGTYSQYYRSLSSGQQNCLGFSVTNAQNGFGNSKQIAHFGFVCGGSSSNSNYFQVTSNTFGSVYQTWKQNQWSDNANIGLNQSSLCPQLQLNTGGSISSTCDVNIKFNIKKLDQDIDLDFAKNFILNTNIYKFNYNQYLQDLSKHSKNECNCTDQQACLQYQQFMFTYSTKNHVNFMKQDLEQINQLNLNRNQNNISESAIQYLLDNNIIDQQKSEQFKQQAIQEEVQNSEQVAKTELITILFLHNKSLQKEVNQLKSDIAQIKQFLNLQ